ncbi:MAG TPA: NrdH-redoxin [Paenibacillaceae bacterium]|nr:NrdH-redoxin [Paenibacillaceae bacterium]
MKKNKTFYITIYTREGCELCVKVKEKVQRAARHYPITLEMVDIRTDEALLQEYGCLIPVVHIDGEKVFVSKMAERWLLRELEIRSN